jgi:hypothetical protein
MLFPYIITRPSNIFVGFGIIFFVLFLFFFVVKVVKIVAFVLDFFLTIRTNDIPTIAVGVEPTDVTIEGSEFEIAIAFVAMESGHGSFPFAFAARAVVSARRIRSVVFGVRCAGNNPG